MTGIYARNEIVLGEVKQKRLLSAHVAIAGIGGVGSFAAEALARAGVGHLTLIDHDVIDETNLNRQIHALRSTIGQKKVQVMKARIEDINPQLEVIAKDDFISEENVADIFDGNYDYIIDAVDTVSAKLAIILLAKARNISVISSMGTANKLDNTQFAFVDIAETSVCPLAKVMRRELKKRGITEGVPVLYSLAPVVKAEANTNAEQRRPTVGSISYVPATAGLLLAGKVINTLVDNE